MSGSKGKVTLPGGDLTSLPPQLMLSQQGRKLRAQVWKDGEGLVWGLIPLSEKNVPGLPLLPPLQGAAVRLTCGH